MYCDTMGKFASFTGLLDFLVDKPKDHIAWTSPSWCEVCWTSVCRLLDWTVSKPEVTFQIVCWFSAWVKANISLNYSSLLLSLGVAVSKARFTWLFKSHPEICFVWQICQAAFVDHSVTSKQPTKRSVAKWPRIREGLLFPHNLPHSMVSTTWNETVHSLHILLICNENSVMPIDSSFLDILYVFVLKQSTVC